MDNIMMVSFTILGLLAFFLGSSVWIGISLLAVGIAGMGLFTSANTFNVLPTILWNSTSGSTLIALPLFIFMGEIIFRSKISENLFKGLSPWLNKLPGRLLHVNVVACTLFAAVSGSSAATCATVGQITVPELDKRKYDRGMVLGTLGSSGTLGFLIPPSLIMLVYGIAGDVSIGKLFIAGVIPGLMLAGSFILYIIIKCLINPELAPSDGVEYTWSDRLKYLPLLLPVIILILFVLGSIYLGVATPTEASAVGVLGALLFAKLSHSLTWQVFKEALMGSVKTNCMIVLIMAGASYLSVVIGYLGIPAGLTQFIAELGVSRYLLIIMLSIMYLIMGCLLDGFSMVVMSLPIALPLIKLAGFDPLWFGIYLVIMIQISQITPPVGFNLFIINGLTGENIFKIARYTMPTFIIMLIITALLTLYPEIVMYLPNLMIK